MLKTEDIKTILFDLDGTIVASKSGVIGSVKKAFKNLKFNLPPEDTLDSFMGPPLLNCFTDVCKLSTENALKAMVLYRKYYESTGLFDAKIYDGIEDLLIYLKTRGYHLGVATSKNEKFAKIVLEHFDLLKYFGVIGATPLGKDHWTKKDSILKSLEGFDDSSLKTSVLIGDRKFDAEGAKQAGIDSIGVLYGYGTSEEVEHCGFSKVVGTVSDLKALF